MALYGKYRPNSFSDMVGQEAPKATLLNAIRLQRLAHAYLFCGTRGTGKTSSARILAKAINCINITETGDPCSQCELCIGAQEEKLTDIIEIDAASNRGIDEIRELRERVAFAPNRGKAKIYIIDEVHMLTKEAFNALLKTLEEPPKHAYFILATTEYHKVPETIRSRCQTFFFTNISTNDIVSRLEHICKEEAFEYEKEGLEILAKRASGGLRDAISLLEQSSNYGPITAENLRKSLGIISSDFLAQFLISLQLADSEKAFGLLTALQNEGRSIEEFAKDFLGYLQEQFHIYIKEKNELLPWLMQVISFFEKGLQRSKRFEIPPLALEMAIAQTMLLQESFVNQLTTVSSSAAAQPQPTPAIQAVPVDPVLSNPVVSNAGFSSYDDLMPPSDFGEEEPKAKKEDSSLPPWETEKPKGTEKIASPQGVKSAKADPVSKPLDSRVSSSSEVSLEVIIKKWNELCSTLPRSLQTILREHSSAHGFTGNVLTLAIEGESNKVLVSSEKKLKQIQDKFSESLGKKILVDFLTEEVSTDEMSVSEVESLLQF